MTEPLTPEAEAAVTEPWQNKRVRELLVQLDALRASLDPDNAEAVAAWASALHEVEYGTPETRPGPGRFKAAALLRARAEAGR